ncbi:MAG: LysM peptidoglycan-binding domain-containing protein [Chloroflexi bacterium]|nr:LysM peptidoglycan-binding domain-containing protein [Chloroflexota bacterium]
MESLRQIGIGILLAAISITVILGGFTLATAEGNLSTSVLVTETIQAVIPTDLPTELPPTELALPSATAVASLTLQPTQTTVATTSTPIVANTSLPTMASISTSTSHPSATFCSMPAGWISIVVQPFDTLGTIAQTYQMSSATIKQGNCMTSDQLVAGKQLFVLPRPASTQIATSVTCGAPYGWINYYVVSGDTLYGIGTRYRVSVYDLQQANCLGTSVYIQTGKALKVPNVATIAPLFTPIPATLVPTVQPATELPPATAEPPVATIAPPTDIPTPIPELPTATPTGPYGGLGGG